MARKKANAALAALQASGCNMDALRTDEDWKNAAANLLCAIQHLGDAKPFNFYGASAEAKRRYDNDLISADGSSGNTGPRHYSGWDRIHEDGLAEGRVMGNDWNDAGVDYSLGFKVRR